MRPFNLGESRIAERAACRGLLTRRVRVIALLAALTVVVAAVCHGCRMSVTNAATQLKSELADVQARCTQVKRDMSEVKARASQRKWQRQLADGSKRWLNVMESILARVPNDVWLNRLESSEQNSSVTVEGQAASFASLSAFIGATRSDKVITEVRISNTRVTALQGAPVVEFSLQVKLKGPAGSDSGQTPATEQPQAVPEVPET